MANGWTQEQILENYPSFTTEGMRAGLAYTSEVLHSERAYPIKTP